MTPASLLCLRVGAVRTASPGGSGVTLVGVTDASIGARMDGAIVKGGVAGVVGTWVMDLATWVMYRREDPKHLRQEKRARIDGKDPAHASARRIARAIGSDAARAEPNAGGVFLHVMFGVGPGMAYAKLRERWPWTTAGKGALWGAILFVVNDEVAEQVLRIAGRPREYPWQAHLRGLVGHVVLGVATHLTLEALDEATLHEEAPPGSASVARGMEG